jgi:hypothetical protein
LQNAATPLQVGTGGELPETGQNRNWLPFVDSNRSEGRPEPFYLDALQGGKLIFVVHTWAGTRSPPRNKSLEFLATLGDYLSKTIAGRS